MALGIASIIGIITSVVLVAPLIHDLNQKQPLGTAYANIGKGFGKGISDLTSVQIRPAVIPTFGFRLEIPDWLQPK